MTVKKIKETIQRLERDVFILEMKDTLDNADYSLLKTMNDEINDLKSKLKKEQQNEWK